MSAACCACSSNAVSRPSLICVGRGVCVRRRVRRSHARRTRARATRRRVAPARLRLCRGAQERSLAHPQHPNRARSRPARPACRSSQGILEGRQTRAPARQASNKAHIHAILRGCERRGGRPPLDGPERPRSPPPLGRGWQASTTPPGPPSLPLPSPPEGPMIDGAALCCVSLFQGFTMAFTATEIASKRRERWGASGRRSPLLLPARHGARAPSPRPRHGRAYMPSACERAGARAGKPR
jgi:hypothetical protein